MKNRIFLVFTVTVLCSLFSGCSENNDLKLVNSDGIVIEDYKSEEGNSNDSVNTVKTNNEDEIAEDYDNSRLFYVVYVCGAVNKPGIYELPENSRIFDAISEAGGYSKDAVSNYLNLAKIIEDEEMIYVPSIDELENGFDSSEFMAYSGTATNENNVGKKVNINSATKEELMTLPGIGESKANTIISYRDEHGKFNAIEDLMQITGIKEGLFNKVKDSICVK